MEKRHLREQEERRIKVRRGGVWVRGETADGEIENVSRSEITPKTCEIMQDSQTGSIEPTTTPCEKRSGPTLVLSGVRALTGTWA